jgi:hypothetical protein
MARLTGPIRFLRELIESRSTCLTAATAELPERCVIDGEIVIATHLGSWDAPGGIDATDLDSIGETGGMTGSFIGPL